MTPEGELLFSKALKGNGIGAAFFSARHGSKNPGLVLRPLCPYTVALRGVTYTLLFYAVDVRVPTMLATCIGMRCVYTVCLCGINKETYTSGRNRFDSFRFRNFRTKKHRFDSVRQFAIHLFRFDAVRPVLCERVMAWSGSVRFRVRFRPVPKSNASVRFGFLFLPDTHVHTHTHTIRQRYA